MSGTPNQSSRGGDVDGWELKPGLRVRHATGAEGVYVGPLPENPYGDDAVVYFDEGATRVQTVKVRNLTPVPDVVTVTVTLPRVEFVASVSNTRRWPAGADPSNFRGEQAALARFRAACLASDAGEGR